MLNVTVYGELDPIPLSTLLTRVTTAVLASSETALGVFWSNGALIIPKPIFIEFALDVLPEGAPLYIWVDFRVGQDGNSMSSGFTQGMEALGHKEIEVTKAPESVPELRERLYALAGYLVENGPVINDGDTIGEDESEKIKVVFTKSNFGYKNEVMSLLYINEFPVQPWWRRLRK